MLAFLPTRWIRSQLLSVMNLDKHDLPVRPAIKSLSFGTVCMTVCMMLYVDHLVMLSTYYPIIDHISYSTIDHISYRTCSKWHPPRFHGSNLLGIWWCIMAWGHDGFLFILFFLCCLQVIKEAVRFSVDALVHLLTNEMRSSKCCAAMIRIASVGFSKFSKGPFPPSLFLTFLFF